MGRSIKLADFTSSRLVTCGASFLYTRYSSFGFWVKVLDTNIALPGLYVDEYPPVVKEMRRSSKILRE